MHHAPRGFPSTYLLGCALSTRENWGRAHVQLLPLYLAAIVTPGSTQLCSAAESLRGVLEKRPSIVARPEAGICTASSARRTPLPPSRSRHAASLVIALTTMMRCTRTERRETSDGRIPRASCPSSKRRASPGAALGLSLPRGRSTRCCRVIRDSAGRLSHLVSLPSRGRPGSMLPATQALRHVRDPRWGGGRVDRHPHLK
jgi:hypothetical protein